MSARGDYPPAAVITAFDLDPGSAELLAGGLINRSFLALRRGERAVLQQVSDIFGPGLQEDLAAVTAHLAARGLETPRLLPARDGRFTVIHDAERWRLWRYVPGVTNSIVASPAQARAAGRLVAEFHAALLDFEHAFQSTRLGVHDTPAHMGRLEAALENRADHPAFRQVEPLAREVLERYGRLPELPATPARIVHGDLKISNVVFAQDTGAARCLIDLDTVGPMALPVELGDAMRSWCNTGDEDDPNSAFALEVFAAAMEGYGSVGRRFITTAEWQAILPATLTIAIELAARFCTDALMESYFAWDRARFASASAHNQARTRGQLALAASLSAQWEEAAAALAAAFNPPGEPAAS